METAKCDHFVTDRNWYYKLNVNTIGGVTLNVITFIGFHCSWITTTLNLFFERAEYLNFLVPITSFYAKSRATHILDWKVF